MIYRTLADLRFRSVRLYNSLQFAGWRARQLLKKTDVKPNYVTACPSCFHDQGLKLLAARVSIEMSGICPNCKLRGGRKMRLSELQYIEHTFFSWGTIQRPDYGGYPAVVSNEHQKTSVKFSDWLEPDVRLFEKWFGRGFFLYGPRYWMFGCVTPLEDLQNAAKRSEVIGRILKEYPAATLEPGSLIYRVRRQPNLPDNPEEYDSPPGELGGKGRLDSPELPILYASADLPVCIHECRTTAEDDIYVATLSPTRTLRLLDLTDVLIEDGVTEFESLDLAVHMLFLAGECSYEISRDIAKRAQAAGFDGLIFPSYFSLLRTGAMPFLTSFGISHRRIPNQRDVERAKIVPNLALFGRPIQEGVLAVRSLNRLMINAVEYHVHFGPVSFRHQVEEG